MSGSATVLRVNAQFGPYFPGDFITDAPDIAAVMASGQSVFCTQVSAALVGIAGDNIIPVTPGAED